MHLIVLLIHFQLFHWQLLSINQILQEIKTFFMISSTSSFEIIKAVVPKPRILLRIPISDADYGAVNPNGNKTFSS